MQEVLAHYAGWLVQVSIGDKGSYLYATFGAPIAHDDDAARAVAAALELRAPPPQLAYSGPVRMESALANRAPARWAQAHAHTT